jgi:hypothetical protein
MLLGWKPADWLVEVSCQSSTPARMFMVNVGLKTWLYPAAKFQRLFGLPLPGPAGLDEPQKSGFPVLNSGL